MALYVLPLVIISTLFIPARLSYTYYALTNTGLATGTTVIVQPYPMDALFNQAPGVNFTLYGQDAQGSPLFYPPYYFIKYINRTKYPERRLPKTMMESKRFIKITIKKDGLTRIIWTRKNNLVSIPCQ